MATSKDLAESYFQQAVNLEKVERKKRVQNFDKIFKLYEEVIQIDPNHAGAGHVAAGIRHADLLSRSEKTKDTIDQDKENDPNGIFTHMSAITTQKTIGPGSVVSKLNVLFPMQRPLEKSLEEKKYCLVSVNNVRAAN